jgi:hypothetical protein
VANSILAPMTPDILIIGKDNREKLDIKQTRVSDAATKRISDILRKEADTEQKEKGHVSELTIEVIKVAHLLDPM